MKPLFLFTIATCLATALTGCANAILNPFKALPEPITQPTEKIFLGIPSILSFEASSVRLDNEWVLTAAHNYVVPFLQMKEIHLHPTCDIALIYDPVDKPVTPLVIGTAFTDDEIINTGYPIYYPITGDEGQYKRDVFMPDSYWPNCQFSGATTGLMVGMSGGGVWRKDNHQLIGINSSFSIFDQGDGEALSYFVSLKYLSGWIKDVTGKVYLSQEQRKDVPELN
ncbi:hypothetical protein ACP3V3_16805 [Vibrio sp. PNB22_3_1]